MIKYTHNKNNYLKLKQIQNGGNNEYKYFLIHGTKNLDNLINIFKSKYIYPGKDVEISKRWWLGDTKEYSTPSHNIYMNINFNDINNLNYSFPFSVIIDPKILKKYGGTFGLGWGYSPNNIIIEKNDMYIDDKLNKIKYKLLNINMYLPEILAKAESFMLHEIIINHKISTKYIIGIICKVDESKYFNEINELKKLTKNKIPIFTTNVIKDIKYKFLMNFK